MIEIKLLVEDVDYESIAKFAIPILKEKLAEDGKGVAGFIGKYVPEAALGGAVSGFLKFLSPEKQEEMVVKLLSQYSDNIIKSVYDAASEKGISIGIKELSVKKAE